MRDAEKKMTTEKQIAANRANAAHDANRNLARSARAKEKLLSTRTQFQPAGSAPDTTGNPNDFNALPNTAEAEQAPVKKSANPFFIGSYRASIALLN